MKVIVYQRPGEPAAIVRPNPEVVASIGLDGVALQSVPSGVDYQILDEADVPQDRTFRNAWKADAGAIDVDMAVAVEIHKEHLRALRKPLLEASDVEFIRAIETGNKTKQNEIAAKKQALRDVTTDPIIAAASTPEQLKAAVPAVLKE